MTDTKQISITYKKEDVSNLDSIVVNGHRFVSNARYAKLLGKNFNLWKIANYLKTRTLKHECSLARQGHTISVIRKNMDTVENALDRFESMMEVQDNAILYWNKRYDKMKIGFIAMTVLAATLVIGLASYCGYAHFRSDCQSTPVSHMTHL